MLGSSNGLWISSVCGKNTNVTMENILDYIRLEYSCEVLSSHGTWIGTFISDFGHSANNYAKLIFIKFAVHVPSCNVFNVTNEIAAPISIRQKVALMQTLNRANVRISNFVSWFSENSISKILCIWALDNRTLLT